MPLPPTDPIARRGRTPARPSNVDFAAPALNHCSRVKSTLSILDDAGRICN